jgi:predicted component of type VI protein secretion system
MADNRQQREREVGRQAMAEWKIIDADGHIQEIESDIFRNTTEAS